MCIRDSYRSSNVLSVANESFYLASWLGWELSLENQEQLTKSFQLASKAYAAYFQLAQHGEATQVIKIPSLPTVEHNGLGIIEQGRVHPNRWKKAYYTAVVVRDQESMDSLASFPVELIKSSSSKADNYAYTLVEMIQSYHYKRDDFVDLLKKQWKKPVL